MQIEITVKISFSYLIDIVAVISLGINFSQCLIYLIVPLKILVLSLLILVVLKVNFNVFLLLLQVRLFYVVFFAALGP